ncbi:MAG: MraY family glycosyltransferase [Syntrophobacteraceae bacterium]
MIFVLASCISVLVATLLIPPLVRLALKIGMVDRPDERKVHATPVPKCGGIAVLAGSLFPMLFLLETESLAAGIVIGSLCLLTEALIDDILGLGYRAKFCGQVIAACITLHLSGLSFQTLGELWPGLRVDCECIGFPLSVLFLVATTNIINLSDGLDGLAGGICLLTFTCTGLLSLMQNDHSTLAVCVCVMGGIVGFLRYNTFPAVVFLGDTGSQFLGFMAGIVMLMLIREQSYSPVLPMYLLGIPVFDTLFSLIRRGSRGQPLFEPDDRHFHHKLLRLGLGHDQAVITLYSAQFCIIYIGWELRGHSDFVLLSTYLALTVTLLILPVAGNRLGRHSFMHLRYGAGRNGDSGGNAKFSSKREFISEIAWKFLLFALCLFFLASPLIIKSIPSEFGTYSLSVLVLLVAIRLMKPGAAEVIIKTTAYLASIYYIIALDFSGQTSLAWNPSGKESPIIYFLFLGGCYCVYIVTTVEPIPISSFDYLLLVLAVFTFFLPEPVRFQYDIQTTATKVFLVLASFELVFYRLRNRLSYLVAGAVPSLCLIVLKAFRYF